MTSAKVVISIVSYKSADLTIRCLQSICNERKLAKFEIATIVVDNASGDFPEISAAIERNAWSSWASLVLAPRNGGFGFGNNIVIRSALETMKPEYIYLLNPDTEVRPGAISALVQFLEANGQVGIAGSSFENSDGSDWPIAFRFPTLLSEICQGLDLGFISKLLSQWQVPKVMQKVAQPTDWVSGASMMVRSEVFLRIGGFDERYFLYFEETDFSYRARRAGFSTWYVPESRVMHYSGYSTHVTSHTETKQRFPDYWFASRRRYFAITHGAAGAKLIDAVAIGASLLGWLKKIVTRQTNRIVPHLTRDLWRHSILRHQNRKISAAITSVSREPTN
jgi:GT2 family glycosyltransferase